jgi:pteridine reductase
MVDIHAKKPLKGYSAYCAAKAGLVMVTESLAYELAPHIRVNGIAAGFMLPPEDTNQLDANRCDDIRQRIPLQRFGGAEPVAQAVYYLAQANYVTGSILTVDGGRHLHM